MGHVVQGEPDDMNYLPRTTHFLVSSYHTFPGLDTYYTDPGQHIIATHVGSIRSTLDQETSHVWKHVRPDDRATTGWGGVNTCGPILES